MIHPRLPKPKHRICKLGGGGQLMSASPGLLKSALLNEATDQEATAERMRSQFSPFSSTSCVCSLCMRKTRDSSGRKEQDNAMVAPDSRVSGALEGSQRPGSELSCNSPISGLPADIGLLCLYRAPRRSHPLLRSVCKNWSCILKSEDFYQERKRLGFSEKWLYVLASSRSSGEMTWQAFDPARSAWRRVPSLPFDTQKVRGVASVVLPDGRLLVCGGMTWDCRPLDSMYWYDPVTDRWERGVIMRTPRSCFATAVIDGRLFVAGGTGIERSELNSAEVYDPVTHSWAPVASMRGELPHYDSAVLEGKLHITEGWTWPYHFAPRGEVYDPNADAWQPMEVGMKEGWTGPSTVVDQLLLLVPEIDEVGQGSGRRIKLYDPAADTWRPLDGPPVPREVEPPLAVASIGRRIYVVGRRLSLAYSDLSEIDGGSCDSMAGFQMGEWTHIPGGEDASYKHAIVCKVLEA